MDKIMVVDDEAAISTHLEERLAWLGYEVVARASSGEEAVRQARRLKPDLILMDIVMSGSLDGIEAARLIKKEYDIPVIFLTAYGDDTYVRRAKVVVPYGYIIKPFQDSALRAAIEIALYNRKTASALKESEKKWRELAENFREGIILADEQGTIFFWNRGAEKLFGYPAKEALGRPLVFPFPPATGRALQADLDRCRMRKRSAGPGKWKEVGGVKKEGRSFLLEFSLSTWKPEKGLVFIGLARDITERKLSEERLQDVQSLVKANVRGIQELMDLQRSGKYAKQPLEGIVALSARLSDRQAPARVDFADYIRNLAGRLFQAYGVHSRTVGLQVLFDNVRLDLRTALPCGLITSELVSNALKFAFPGQRKGNISVNFRRSREGDCTLTVRDNGVGLPKNMDLLKSESAGFQIVKDLTRQLNGTIVLSRRGGTKFTITFKTA
jgi:PAS domain S-box-containing protein